MIPFTDSMGNKRGIDISLSYCGKYLNLTLYAAKNTNGSTVQIAIEHKEELINLINNLGEE
jgi:hypothetical protein